MLELLQHYSISEIFLFIILLALAFKSVVSFFEWFEERIKKALQRGCNETVTNIVTIPVVKVRGKWKIQSKTKAVVDIATGFYNKALDDSVDDFVDYCVENSQRSVLYAVFMEIGEFFCY